MAANFNEIFSVFEESLTQDLHGLIKNFEIQSQFEDIFESSQASGQSIDFIKGLKESFLAAAVHMFLMQLKSFNFQKLDQQTLSDLKVRLAKVKEIIDVLEVVDLLPMDLREEAQNQKSFSIK